MSKAWATMEASVSRGHRQEPGLPWSGPAARGRRTTRRMHREALTVVTGFENRLRAAMEFSVAAEQPPANLLARVRRRHRRHLARLAAVGVAAVVASAVAVPPAWSALFKHATPRPAASAALPPGQIYGCDQQTYGALASDWRGSTAPGQGSIRFLTSLGSLNEYTLRDGLPTATFTGCAAGTAARAALRSTSGPRPSGCPTGPRSSSARAARRPRPDVPGPLFGWPGRTPAIAFP